MVLSVLHGLQRRGICQEVYSQVANIIRKIALQQISFNKISHTAAKFALSLRDSSCVAKSESQSGNEIAATQKMATSTPNISHSKGPPIKDASHVCPFLGV